MESNINKNTIIALVLALIVMMGWQFLYEGPKRQKAEQIEKLKRIKKQFAAKEQQITMPDGTVKTVTTTPKVLTNEQALQGSPRVNFSNSKISGSINLKGARIDNLVLSNYNTKLNDDSEQVTLLSPAKTDQSYFIELGWRTNNNTIQTPNANTVWQADSTQLAPNKPLTLTYKNPQNIEFKIIITIDDNYLFEIDQLVNNQSFNEITLTPYALINRNRPEDSNEFIIHQGPFGVFNEVLEEISYSDLEDEPNKGFEVSTGWIGITDKYWFTALVPQGKFSPQFQYNANGFYKKVQANYLVKPITIAASGDAVTSTQLIAGAKEFDIIEQYQEQFNIPLFDRAIDFGWFYFLTKPIFRLLTWLYDLIGNFGIAIIALTVIIKLLLFPLARKSFVAMGKMKTLTPKIKQIQERHKDDRMEMQKAMMALYKKEKVNPASGCLPILIQIPIFFSLYKVLMVSIEMRHAPFFGWITDLSAPDPTSIFNLFGLLPWGPIFAIGIWPLIMAGTMYLQQKASPTPTDPMQAKIMKYLPLIFLIIGAGFPAGLVIYWAVSNLLTVLQQYVIGKTIAKK